MTGKDLDPNAYPKDDEGVEDLTDRGDTVDEGQEEEEEHVEEADERKPPAKKAAAKKKAAADEGEEEEEEGDEGEEEEDEETDERGASVPLHVLRKSQQKRRDAEKRAQELEDRLKALEGDKSDRQKERFDKLNSRMDELYDQIEDARAEGRTKEAAKLQRELDGIRSDMTRAEAAWHATKQAAAQQALQAYNALVSELEAIDSRFDAESEDYDEDLTDRVAELTEAFEARNMSAPDALRKALRTIMGKDPFRDARRLIREDKKPAAEKRKPDIKKNLDAAKKQPPAEKGISRERPGRINPLQLSEKDWDDLPESTRRKMRGDFLDA